MEATRCLYASKPCRNERSKKDNGTLHRLCAMHRAKANDAQRRWHSRRRALLRRDPIPDVKSELLGQSALESSMETPMQEALNDEDLDLLEELLCSDGDWVAPDQFQANVFTKMLDQDWWQVTA